MILGDSLQVMASLAEAGRIAGESAVYLFGSAVWNQI